MLESAFWSDLDDLEALALSQAADEAVAAQKQPARLLAGALPCSRPEQEAGWLCTDLEDGPGVMNLTSPVAGGPVPVGLAAAASPRSKKSPRGNKSFPGMR